MQQLVHRSKEPICRNYACESMLIPRPPLRGTQNQVLFIFSETNAKQIHLLSVEPTLPPSENQSTVYLSPAFENFPHSPQCSKKNKGFCLLISSVNSLHTLGQKSICIRMFDYVYDEPHTHLYSSLIWDFSSLRATLVPPFSVRKYITLLAKKYWNKMWIKESSFSLWSESLTRSAPSYNPVSSLKFLLYTDTPKDDCTSTRFHHPLELLRPSILQATLLPALYWASPAHLVCCQTVFCALLPRLSSPWAPVLHSHGHTPSTPSLRASSLDWRLSPHLEGTRAQIKPD